MSKPRYGCAHNARKWQLGVRDVDGLIFRWCARCGATKWGNERWVYPGNKESPHRFCKARAVAYQARAKP